jgi:hypothetical protein
MVRNAYVVKYIVLALHYHGLAARDAYRHDAYRGDPSLRAEIDPLLAAHVDPTSSIDAPMLQEVLTTSLTCPGTRA